MAKDMEQHDVIRLALVLAVQAEIEGMKAFNAHRERRGKTTWYNEAAFIAKAEKLKDLAYVHNEQL